MLDCTGGLVVSPNADLRRLERAIAAIEEMPPTSRRRMECLLGALKQQRIVLLGECALGQRVMRRREQAKAIERAAAPLASSCSCASGAREEDLA